MTHAAKANKLGEVYVLRGQHTSTSETMDQPTCTCDMNDHVHVKCAWDNNVLLIGEVETTEHSRTGPSPLLPMATAARKQNS